MELGRGGFSVVHYGSSLFNPEARLAIKVISRPVSETPGRKSREAEEIESSIQQEVSVLRSLNNHPNIVSLIDFFEDPQHYYMVEECVEGGELFDRIIKKISYNELEGRELVSHIFDAVQHCHSKLVVHRDIKPENILLRSADDDTHIKVCDFGFAVQLSTPQQCLQQQCGTSGYMSPELIRGAAYSFGVDVWALGVVVFIILGGYTPFFGDDESQCERKVLLGSFEFHPDYWGNVSEEAKDLIRKMLTVDPKQRISLSDAIQHPWLTRCSKDKLAANDITPNVTNLKNFQAQRKLKGAARAIMAVNRLSGGGGISQLLRNSLSGMALDKLVNSAVAKGGGKDG